MCRDSPDLYLRVCSVSLRSRGNSEGETEVKLRTIDRRGKPALNNLCQSDGLLLRDGAGMSAFVSRISAL